MLLLTILACSRGECFKISLGILNTKVNDLYIHATNIVLILKASRPIELSQFQSINLCNVVYKLASKEVVDWTKVLLIDLISLN